MESAVTGGPQAGQASGFDQASGLSQPEYPIQAGHGDQGGQSAAPLPENGGQQGAGPQEGGGATAPTLLEGRKGGEGAQGVPATPEGYALVFPSGPDGGKGLEVDSEALASFKSIAHQQGLTQTQAASLANLYASIVGRQAETQAASLAATEQQWIGDMQKEGNFAGTVASARLAMERFGSEELSVLLNTTRLGSHPALVRFVAKVGKALGEPASMRGGGAISSGLNFYPTMNKD